MVRTSKNFTEIKQSKPSFTWKTNKISQKQKNGKLLSLGEPIKNSLCHAKVFARFLVMVNQFQIQNLSHWRTNKKFTETKQLKQSLT